MKYEDSRFGEHPFDWAVLAALVVGFCIAIFVAPRYG